MAVYGKSFMIMYIMDGIAETWILLLESWMSIHDTCQKLVRDLEI